MLNTIYTDSTSNINVLFHSCQSYSLAITAALRSLTSCKVENQCSYAPDSCTINYYCIGMPIVSNTGVSLGLSTRAEPYVQVWLVENVYRNVNAYDL
jgi:hypothetical protein